MPSFKTAVAPIFAEFQRRCQKLAHLRERVFGARTHFGKQLAVDDAVLFELARPQGQWQLFVSADYRLVHRIVCRT